MHSKASRRFLRQLDLLPAEVQRLARKNLALWKEDPTHPSLQFRRLTDKKDLYTVRIGDHYRALGVATENQIIWVWIGTHADYDRLVNG